jgi:hypothetical protein
MASTAPAIPTTAAMAAPSIPTTAPGVLGPPPVQVGRGRLYNDDDVGTSGHPPRHHLEGRLVFCCVFFLFFGHINSQYSWVDTPGLHGRAAAVPDRLRPHLRRPVIRRHVPGPFPRYPRPPTTTISNPPRARQVGGLNWHPQNQSTESSKHADIVKCLVARLLHVV